ncbi:hypothetical protein WI665_07865, partial [Vibrio cholerae]
PCTSFSYRDLGVLADYWYGWVTVFAFIVKRFRVFRAPLHQASLIFTYIDFFAFIPTPDIH